MVFSSSIFLFAFLPITLAVYYLIQKRYRNGFLLLASYLFFIWMQPKAWWILLASVIINYTTGILIDRAEGKSWRRFFLILGLCGNLALLAYFKYFNFGLHIFNDLTGGQIAAKNIILPLGISFFTFSGISYLVDVYQKTSQANRNFVQAALYIALFPKLLQGPIARYRELQNDLSGRNVTVDDFVYGIRRFIIGLAKKVIIADTLGVTVDAIWKAGVPQNTVEIAWLGSIAYTLQIYFDFAGYSDMAVGLGRMFGFHIPENFNFPYISKSISEFWRRWHMTLGTWFRDYLYIPLGGNRKGSTRTYINLAVVFFFTGLWHGAAFHFIAWGLFNGFFVLVERFVKFHASLLPAFSDRIKTVLLTFYALFVTNLAWILFRAPGLHAAWGYIKTMFGIGLGTQPGFQLGWYLDDWTIFALVLAVLFSSPFPSMMAGKVMARHVVMKKYLTYGGLLILLYLSLLRVASGTYHSFIYFQF